MPKPNIHPDVLAELRTRFPSTDVSEARELLEKTKFALVPEGASVEAARIQMAAIRLAHGSLAKLRSALALGTTDWRDLLVAAGLGGRDWRQILLDEGFRVPR